MTVRTRDLAGAAVRRHWPRSGIGSRGAGRVVVGIGLAAALALGPTPAAAAGGHFDVDDAAILDAGRCQVETWALRSPQVPASLIHIGPGCRTGPVELSLNIEWLAHPLDRTSATRTLTPQLKWAMPWTEGVAVGAAATSTYDVDRGNWPQRTLYGILTWTATPAVAVHANAGADWTALDRWTPRAGLSAEWTASARWSVLAEHVLFTRLHTTRLGARLKLAEGLSIDVSAAQVQPGTIRLWGVGLTQEFGR